MSNLIKIISENNREVENVNRRLFYNYISKLQDKADDLVNSLGNVKGEKKIKEYNARMDIVKDLLQIARPSA